MTVWNNRQLLGKARDSARAIDPVVGVTVNALTNIIDLDTRQNRDTEIIIENTGTEILYYVINVQNDYNEDTYFTVFFNEVIAGQSDEIILGRHARLFINIKSQVAGLHTTCLISIIGGT
jgi:hypothetical protein